MRSAWSIAARAAAAQQRCSHNASKAANAPAKPHASASAACGALGLIRLASAGDIGSTAAAAAMRFSGAKQATLKSEIATIISAIT